MLSSKLWPFCPSLNVLKYQTLLNLTLSIFNDLWFPNYTYDLNKHKSKH